MSTSFSLSVSVSVTLCLSTCLSPKVGSSTGYDKFADVAVNRQDGSVYLAGFLNDTFYVTKLDAEGSVDRSYEVSQHRTHVKIRLYLNTACLTVYLSSAMESMRVWHR